MTILTILSKTSQNLDSFGGLLDRGGQQLDVMYEPGTPIADDGAEGEFVGAEVGGERDELQGRDVPEFQRLGPVLMEEQKADKIVVGEVEITVSSSIDKLRNAAKYLKVSSSGSKQKIYTRIQRAGMV